MTTLRKNILKLLTPSCVKPRTSPFSKPNSRVSNASSRRLSLCDVSSASSCSLASDLSNSLIGSNVHIFTLAELKKITQNFSKSNFLGEGGFGRVYKGFIDDKLRPGLKPQPVAVKNLDLDGKQGHREWLAEVIFLGQLTHPHLVKLVGYCCEDEHRLLVYEYMPRGSLENQLFQNYTATLPWLTRLEIAVGAAKGLGFLHEEEKPVIYRDFKASNILLDHDFTTKLSDFGLAIDGPEGDETHVTTRIMGTEGYAAPEYIMTGHVTSMSDVYSFGVVLLELITGRRCLDRTSLPNREQTLVDWARPYLKDSHKVDWIMDPRLEGQYSRAGACKAAALAHQCLSHHAKSRPAMSTVVKTLEALLSLKDIPVPFVYVVPNDQADLTVDLTGKHEEKSKAGAEGKDRHRSGKARWSIYRVWPRRSRAVYSDAALYNTLAAELYSPKNAPKEFKLSCRLD